MVKQRHEQCAHSPAEGGPGATGAGEGAASRPKRFWSKHKTEAVLRLLRGEDIEIVSRDLGVTAASLSQWRDLFLQGGADAFKKLQPNKM